MPVKTSKRKASSSFCRKEIDGVPPPGRLIAGNATWNQSATPGVMIVLVWLITVSPSAIEPRS